MAYCRWSSDDFRCDIYAYAHCGGWYQVHVACRRRDYGPIDPPPPVPFTHETIPQWHERHQAVMKLVRELPLVDIGGPCDGENYEEKTLEDFKSRMLFLRDLGYRFPNSVLEAIDEEIEERDSGK